MSNGDSSSARTIVLLGKMGNGKSATANSLLGHDVFESMPSLGGVTSTCKLHTAVLQNGRILNVIDTPGLFDPAVQSNSMANEIAQCINLAGDGIHSVLFVLSLRNRFSEEEASAFEFLCQIFGSKIADYMIVVFTNGDALMKTTLDQYLSKNCPEQLKNTLKMCGNRTIVFNNWTEDGEKICRQREKLLSLVDSVVEDNGGCPYTNELFQQIKKDQIDEAAEIIVGGEQYDLLVEKIEARMKESISKLETVLAKESAARAKAHQKSLKLQAKAEHELHELRERLSRADHWSRELQEELNRKPNCIVM